MLISEGTSVHIGSGVEGKPVGVGVGDDVWVCVGDGVRDGVLEGMDVDVGVAVLDGVGVLDKATVGTLEDVCVGVNSVVGEGFGGC